MIYMRLLCVHRKSVVAHRQLYSLRFACCTPSALAGIFLSGLSTFIPIRGGSKTAILCYFFVLQKWFTGHRTSGSNVNRRFNLIDKEDSFLLWTLFPFYERNNGLGMFVMRYNISLLCILVEKGLYSFLIALSNKAIAIYLMIVHHFSIHSCRLIRHLPLCILS